jgi:hypothetical protein
LVSVFGKFSHPGGRKTKRKLPQIGIIVNSLVSSRKWAAQRAQKKSLLETTNKTVDDFHEWSGLIHKQKHAKEADPSFGEADLPAHRSEIERGASKRPPHTTPLRCCCCC